jgi:hypothetical protein
MAASFEVAPEIQMFGKRLIKDYHTHLKDRRVEYLFDVSKPKKLKPGEEEPAGDVKIISGLAAWLAGTTEDPYPDPFFVIVIKRHVWLKVEQEREREALVDWFLCRTTIDKKSGAPKKRNPDAQVFTENVKRYGPWHESLRATLKAAGQDASLPFDQPPPERGAKKGPRRIPKAERAAR